MTPPDLLVGLVDTWHAAHAMLRPLDRTEFEADELNERLDKLRDAVTRIECLLAEAPRGAEAIAAFRQRVQTLCASATRLTLV